MLRAIGNFFTAGDLAWAWRRRLVIAIVFSCLGQMIYSTGWEHDVAKHSATMSQLGLIIIAVIGTYIGAATWDDKSKREIDKPVAAQPSVSSSGITVVNPPAQPAAPVQPAAATTDVTALPTKGA